MSKCDDLSSLSDFTEYVGSIERVTSYDSSRLEECKDVICLAVYGTGNPDISGIGVTAGFIIETALGFCLAALLFLHTRLKTGNRVTDKLMPLKKEGSRTGLVTQVLVSGVHTFFESAAYFAIALQIATIVIVSRKDFGLSTRDFGAIEAQIAHAVSIISLLPLLYPVTLLDGRGGGVAARGGRSDPRSNPRLFLLTLAVSLSFYPFLSRNLHGFGASPISDDDAGEVSTSNWRAIEKLCFRDGLDSLRSDHLYSSLDALELTASLIIYVATLWKQSGLLTIHFHSRSDRRLDEQPSPGLAFRIMSARDQFGAWIRRHTVPGVLLLLVPLALACPLLWIVFRLRHLQEELAVSVGGHGSYSGNDWGFGQIVSVVLFLPIGVNMFYCAIFGGRDAFGLSTLLAA